MSSDVPPKWFAANLAQLLPANRRAFLYNVSDLSVAVESCELRKVIGESKL